MTADPIVVSKPVSMENTERIVEDVPDVFPSCAVTRSMSKKAREVSETVKPSEPDSVDLSETFFSNLSENGIKETVTAKSVDSSGVKRKGVSDVFRDEVQVPLSRQKLIDEQRGDPEVASLFKLALPVDELNNVPRGYFFNEGVLMRKWRSPTVPASEEWSVVYQIVVPKVYRKEVLRLAHEIPMGGHLGVRKTYDKITRHFYWPKIRRCVSNYCKTCHACQVVGKPNQTIPAAPLKPIPAFEEPFSRVIVDCVGPLPKTKSGNQYLLTIMCASTRFPEAIPLRNITAPKISKALINFFTLVGLPKEIQSDQGSNFMSGLFQQVVYQLGAKQIKSTRLEC